MKKAFFLFLILLSFLVIFMKFSDQITVNLLGLKPRAGLRITSIPPATVYIEGIEAGKTPYQDENLESKDYQVKLIGDKVSWEGAIRLNKGTLSVINRELAATAASSSGEILTLSEGIGIIITSSPSGADVEVDGQSKGITPVSVSDLTPGEHTFILSHKGYLKRSIRAALPEKMALRLDFDLAIAEINITSQPIPTQPLVLKVVVKQTSVGYLRIREKPTINSKEVARVKTGESLVLLEELNGWMKIQLANGLSGYVSSQYVQKQI